MKCAAISFIKKFLKNQSVYWNKELNTVSYYPLIIL